MYLLLSHPTGWRHGSLGAVHRQGSPTASCDARSMSPFVLHLEQNRSSLPDGARVLLPLLLGLAFASTLGPALRGSFIVPAAVLAAMASLLLAMEIHVRLPVPFERIEIDGRAVRLLSHRGLLSEFPSHWARIEQVRRTPVDLSLVLTCRGRSVEFGRCLGIDERRAIVPIVADALAHVRGGSR